MDEHYRRIELNISMDELHRLPRNAAYKYEYFGGRAVLTPRPKSFSCVRDLAPVTAEPLHPVDVRPLPRPEATGLVNLFFGAVRQTQPFAARDNEAARKASDDCFNKTLNGDDGPLIEAACFQAFSERMKGEKEQAVGGMLITLVPKEILTVPYAGMWATLPPKDAVEHKLGIPHLTWVFVNTWEGRRGIASALLAKSVEVLREMGFTELASTFLLDNGPSMLWHWKHDFKLLPGWSAMMREGRNRLVSLKPSEESNQ
jgi:hypothetical protein